METNHATGKAADPNPAIVAPVTKARRSIVFLRWKLRWLIGKGTLTPIVEKPCSFILAINLKRVSRIGW